MRYRSTLLSTTLLSAFVWASQTASALDTATFSEEQQRDEVIVVTANRRPQALNAPLARTTVITRSEIEQYQSTDLKDLLQRQAGIDVARGGGAGGQTALFMRGTNSNHLLVLIDGLRVSDAGTGAFRWELIDLSSVERVEIVRGPRAAQWGSDAIGGVIQIFTRQADGFQLTGTVGSFGEVGAGIAVGDGSQSINLSTRDVEGFSAQNARGFSFDPDKDGFENHQLSGRGVLKLPQGTLTWVGRWLDAMTEFDQGISDFSQMAGKLSYQTSVGAWQLTSEAGRYRNELVTESPFGRTKSITRRTQLSVLGHRYITSQLQWMLGLDTVREEGVNVGSWHERRTHWSAWTSLQGGFNQFSYAASARVDDDDRFGRELSTQLALRWQVNETLRSFVSVGEGFRSPNFSQLFSPGFDGLFAGNPLLQPEESLAYELGLDWTPLVGHQISMSGFDSTVNDLISFTGPDFQAINVSEAHIKGIEIAHQYRSSAWFGEANWTWQDPVDKDLNQPLLRRAKNKGSLMVGYDFGEHTLTAEAIYVGDRRDVGQEILESYTLINLATQWRISSQWSLGARLDNLANENYEPLLGFNAGGRTARITLKWQPDF